MAKESNADVNRESIGEISPEHSFDLEHDSLIRRYKTEIPGLTNRPKTVLVVPSLAELSNDNFWRLLRSLALQQGVDQKEFATLIVINNSSVAVRFAESGIPKYMNGLDHEGPTRYEGHTGELLIERYHENQTHLGILRLFDETKTALLKGRPEDQEKIIGFALENLKNSVMTISNHELSVFKLALTRGVNVFGVDCSSKGKAFEIESVSDNPIGKARNVGGHIAHELLKQSPDSLIDFLDGDCFPSSNYFKEMSELSRFAEGRYLSKPLMSQTVDIPKKIEQTEDKYEKLAALIKYLANSATHNRIKYWQYSRSHNLLGGPQVAVSPKLFREIGGYPTYGSSEDFEFARKLGYKGTPLLMIGGVVHLSDRGRTGSTDGNRRGNPIEEAQDVEAITAARENANKESKTFLESATTVNLITESQYGDAYVTARAKLFRRESIKRRYFLETANKLIPLICQEYAAMDKSSDPTIRLRIALRGKMNERYYDFLNYNKALITAVATAYDIVTTGTEKFSRLLPPKSDDSVFSNPSGLVAEFFKLYLPEYFSPPPRNEPDYDTGKTSGTNNPVNPRDYVHIYEAAYLVEARSHMEELNLTK